MATYQINQIQLPNGDLCIIDTGGSISTQSVYQVTGSSNSSTSVAAATMTIVPMVSTGAIKVGSEAWSVSSDGGVKVPSTGTYRVTGSVYGTLTSNGGGYSYDVFLKHGSSASSNSEFCGSTEYVFTAETGSVPGGHSVGPKLVSLTANENVYLVIRARGGTGTYIANNTATYLLVEHLA